MKKFSFISLLYIFLLNSPSTAETISTSGYHSLFVDIDGEAWGVGSNFHGQLGLGDKDDRTTPTKITGLPTIRASSANGNHSLLLDIHGQVWAFGKNDYGQLGLGDKNKRDKPAKIENLPIIRAIAAGTKHSLFLDEDGQVWSVGYDSPYGSYLTPGFIATDKPIKVDKLSEITAIATPGDRQSMFLNMNNQVLSLGCGLRNSLGLAGSFAAEPMQIMNVQVKEISPGILHGLLLDTDGEVWAFGDNDYGQLGLASADWDITKIELVPKIRSIAAGFKHSLFLDEDGAVWSAGMNDKGQLGLGDQESAANPTRIENLPQIISITTSKDSCRPSSFLLDANGEVWAFGDNSYGQLGLDTQNTKVPTKIGNLPRIMPPEKQKIPTKSARK